jgi:hypothetical protein
MAVFVLVRQPSLSFNSAGKDQLLVLSVIVLVLFGLAVWKWLERLLTCWCSVPERRAGRVTTQQLS